tara:strand:+ start:409 stop:795 length:387 start_codon:yes stop_codon:yes gene_type:complete
MAKQRYWYIDRDRIGIVETGGGTVTSDGVSSDYATISEAKEIRIYAFSRPTKFVAASNSQTPDIPEQFHEALAYKVISMGYKDPRNFNGDMATFFDNDFMKMIKLGRSYSGRNRTQAGYITPYNMGEI